MSSPVLAPWEQMGGDRRLTSGDDGLVELTSATPDQPKPSADSITGLSLGTAADTGLPLIQTATLQPTADSGDGLTGQSGGTQFSTGTNLYILTLEDSGRPLSEQAKAVLGDVRPQGIFKNLGMVTARLTTAQAAALERRPGVLRVEADQQVSIAWPEASSPPASQRKPGGGSTSPSTEVLDWGVRAVWGDKDRRSSSWSINGRAFVLDTGISGNTADLNFNTTLSRDFTGSLSGFYDRQGHGTHVAGTIAAQANNSRGVAGVAPNAEVVSVKVLNDRGSGSYSGIIAGIDYMMGITKPGVVNVANMSLGGGFSMSLNDAILKAAREKGILFSLAAGNSYQDVDSFSPASVGDASKGIYTISAHDINKRNASFTNFDRFGGTDVDNVAYAAPGVNITSLRIDGSTIAYSGTSMAAPHVAGLLLIGGFRSGTASAFAYGSETRDPLAITNLA
ncbi:MAG: S8 family serine peptidase [Prochlorococcaceae cyanobacterium]